MDFRFFLVGIFRFTFNLNSPCNIPWVAKFSYEATEDDDDMESLRSVEDALVDPVTNSLDQDNCQ